jgi:hypothetical protein
MIRQGLILLVLLSPGSARAEVAGFPKWNDVVSREHVIPAGSFSSELKQFLDRKQAEYRLIPYVTDEVNYGVQDYWTTRAELRSKGSGDCEDFATAEFFDLVEAGVPEDDLWVTIVVTRKTGEVHAVLVAGQWVLDKRASRVLSLAEFESFYEPVYGINRTGWRPGPGIGAITPMATR